MLTILNDTHIGVNRVAGTTGRSAQALTDFVHEAFVALLAQADGGNLVILGDLFDQYTVPNSDMVRTFYALADWCERNKAHQLALVAGNHDLSKDSSRLSSFEFVGVLLERQFRNAQKILEPTRLWGDEVYVIPHVRNQDIFNQRLAEVPDGVKYLLLHANYNNGFAEQSDHSLNVSETQAKAQILKGRALIFAHEHQRRKALNGKVLIPGNQIPTSVSDLLGTEGKYYVRIDGEPQLAQVDFDALLGTERALYVERDWREIKPAPIQTDSMFIRVIGDASAQEAADVVTKISKYRQHSESFVITNAVRIEGVEGMDELPATIEAAKGFDVLAAILDTLTEEERKVVHQLLEGTDAQID